MGLFPLRDAERRGRDTNTTTVLGLVSLACALAGAPRVCRGLDLAPHFAAAESFVAAGNYGPAIREYHKIIYQTDDALPRDRARFGIGQCHFFSHDYEQARRALRQLADDGKGEWAAAAQLLIAEILIQEAKYSAAMNELQRLVAEHPQTPQANRAYFLIGKRLFDLGRFDEAAGAIERVGTAFAAGEHGALSVEPGEPVFVQLVDADLYLGENHPGIEIEITSDRDEREKARLRPLAAGRGVLMASLPTALGDPVPGDGTISVCGTDVLTVRYTDDVTAAGNRGVARESKLRVASNALLQICSEDGSQPVDFLLLDGRATIRVRDPDCDVSAERDRVRIEIASADGARKEIELLESAAHSGIFEALVVAASTNAAPSAASVPARNGDRI
jgi:TolA-binding protein